MTFYIMVNGMKYDFGVITAFTDTYSRGLITTPIPSMPTDRTFAVETNASLKYYISFVRKAPLNPNNSYAETSDLWDNGTWLTRVSSLTNRWQARTNGYEMIINNSDTGSPSAPNFEKTERVFISDISYAYKEGEPDNIYGSMTLIVTDQLRQDAVTALDENPNGLSDLSQNYTDIRTETCTPDSDLYVMISNSDGSRWFVLQMGKDLSEGGNVEEEQADYEVDHFSKQTDIIKSYRIHGGPSDPFEYAEMTLSRKAIIEQCPDLDGDILAGCNKLLINGVSSASMIVTKCKLTNNTYNLIAYTAAEVIRSHQLAEESEDGSSAIDGTPIQIIKKLVTMYAGIDESNIVTNATDLDVSVSFKPKVNVWTAVQLCAMAVNAKSFFCEGKFFLIDYTKLTTYNSVYTTYYPTYKGLMMGDLNLHPDDPNDPMYEKVSGNVSIGNEGIDTIINSVSLHYGKVTSIGADGQYYTDDVYYEKTDNDSVTRYTKCDYSSLSIDQYLVTNEDDQDTMTRIRAFTEAIGNFIITYRAEPQTSIGFTMKERINSGDQCGWLRAFPNVCAAKKIFSKAENIESTANSAYAVNTGGIKVLKPQKLIMSSYCRNYPEFTSDYWFGVIENVDLSQSTSNITTHVGMN